MKTILKNQKRIISSFNILKIHPKPRLFFSESNKIKKIPKKSNENQGKKVNENDLENTNELRKILEINKTYLQSKEFRGLYSKIKFKNFNLSDITETNIIDFEDNFIMKNKEIQSLIVNSHKSSMENSNNSLKKGEIFENVYFKYGIYSLNISYYSYINFLLNKTYISIYSYYLKNIKNLIINKNNNELSHNQVSSSFIDLTCDVFNSMIDLSSPHLWFPKARKMKRKIYFHFGPTNSGKTYMAINKLIKSESGIYCAPLRLLAWEIYEKIISSGKVCNLETGQEEIKYNNNTHISCTIEKCNLDMTFKVAVIDEIQLISDPIRGNSWTNSFLGLQAEEIYLCGEERGLWLINELCKKTGDDLEIVKYTRLSTLKAMDTIVKIGSLTMTDNNKMEIRPGDCLIAFSRKSVLYYKYMLSKLYPSIRLNIIYGSLPPKAKKAQAIEFNEGKEKEEGGEYKNILIATDAIGMGLNLNIKRIVFSSIMKYDGKETRRLNESEILQISGRAGRSNVDGEVTALGRDALSYIRKVLSENDVKRRDLTKKREKDGEESEESEVKIREEIIKIGKQFIKVKVKQAKSEIKIENSSKEETGKRIKINSEFEFSKTQSEIKKACLFLSLEVLVYIVNEYDRLFNSGIIEEYSNKTIRYIDILNMLSHIDNFDSKIYFIKDLSKIKSIAKILSQVPNASIEQEYVFSNSPIRKVSKVYDEYLCYLLRNLVNEKKVSIEKEIKEKVDFLKKNENFEKDEKDDKASKIKVESNENVDESGKSKKNKLKSDKKMWKEKKNMNNKLIEEYERNYNFLEIYIFIGKFYKNEFYQIEEAFEYKNVLNNAIEKILVEENIDEEEENGEVKEEGVSFE